MDRQPTVLQLKLIWIGMVVGIFVVWPAIIMAYLFLMYHAFQEKNNVLDRQVIVLLFFSLIGMSMKLKKLLRILFHRPMFFARRVFEGQQEA